jgi:exonuclease III
MRSDIAIATWNINGLFHKVIGDKSKNLDFVRNIKSNDIIFLTETWSQTTLNIPGYKTITSIKTPKLSRHKLSRLSGGITLLYKSKLEKYISVVKNSQNILWCKISKELFKSDNDLYLGGLYLPPEHSRYFEPELFDKLQEDIITFSGKGDVIIIGDFNARTGKLNDFIETDGNKYIQNLNSNFSHNSKRENFDNKINNHGKHLIEICKNCNLRILNGRTKGDSLGKPTFHNKHGTSTIDYAICNTKSINNIKFLVVQEPNYLSDHSLITTWLNIKDDIDLISTTTPNYNFSNKLPSQFMWESVSSRAYTDKLKSSEIQIKFQTFLNNNYPKNDTGVSQCLNEFQDILTEAGNKSLKIKKVKKRKKIMTISNKKWFDKECRLKRHAVRKLANQKHRDPMNENVRNRYHTELKDYKNILNSGVNLQQWAPG